MHTYVLSHLLPGIAVSSSRHKGSIAHSLPSAGPWPRDQMESPRMALILGWVSSGSGPSTGWKEPAGQG